MEKYYNNHKNKFNIQTKQTNFIFMVHYFLVYQFYSNQFNKYMFGNFSMPRHIEFSSPQKSWEGCALFKKTTKNSLSMRAMTLIFSNLSILEKYCLGDIVTKCIKMYQLHDIQLSCFEIITYVLFLITIFYHRPKIEEQKTDSDITNVSGCQRLYQCDMEVNGHRLNYYNG